MRFPLISRSNFRREIISLGNAYRWQIEELELRAQKAEDDYKRLVGSIGRALPMRRDPVGKEVAIVFKIRLRELGAINDQQVVADLRDQLLRELMGLNKDYRGDLRQTMMERVLAYGPNWEH